jgi:ribosomal protein L19E
MLVVPSFSKVVKAISSFRAQVREAQDLVGPQRSQIQKLHRDGLIIRKPVVVHSCARVVLCNEANRKGRHTGTFVLCNIIAKPTCPARCPFFGQRRWLFLSSLLQAVDKGQELFDLILSIESSLPVRQPVVHFHALSF